jgi:hypothetical protein
VFNRLSTTSSQRRPAAEPPAREARRPMSGVERAFAGPSAGAAGGLQAEAEAAVGDRPPASSAAAVLARAAAEIAARAPMARRQPAPPTPTERPPVAPPFVARSAPAAAPSGVEPPAAAAAAAAQPAPPEPPPPSSVPPSAPEAAEPTSIAAPDTEDLAAVAEPDAEEPAAVAAPDTEETSTTPHEPQPRSSGPAQPEPPQAEPPQAEPPQAEPPQAEPPQAEPPVPLPAWLTAPVLTLHIPDSPFGWGQVGRDRSSPEPDPEPEMPGAPVVIEPAALIEPQLVEPETVAAASLVEPEPAIASADDAAINGAPVTAAEAEALAEIELTVVEQDDEAAAADRAMPETPASVPDGAAAAEHALAEAEADAAAPTDGSPTPSAAEEFAAAAEPESLAERLRRSLDAAVQQAGAAEPAEARRLPRSRAEIGPSARQVRAERPMTPPEAAGPMPRPEAALPPASGNDAAEPPLPEVDGDATVAADIAELPERLDGQAVARNRRLYRRVSIAAELEIDGTPGQLLDLSMGGFSASGAAPIEAGLVVPVTLRMSIDGIDIGTRMTARIVYTEAERTGGRFVDLTASQTAFLRYIVTWRGQSVGAIGTTTLLDAITRWPERGHPAEATRLAPPRKTRWWSRWFGWLRARGAPEPEERDQ